MFGLRFPGYVSKDGGKILCDCIWLRVIFKEPVLIVPATGGLEETLLNISSCSLFVWILPHKHLTVVNVSYLNNARRLPLKKNKLA